MTNESVGTIGGLDTGEGIRQDTNKVTEQDVKRAQSDAKKAKQVQIQIKQSKANNNKMANFLTFLLKTIKNEELISAIYNTFFKVIDPRTKIVYLRKSINNIIIVGFFAPFFQSQLEEYGLSGYFQGLYDQKKEKLSFLEYISYIKNLSKKYHDNIPVNQNNLVNLLSLIIGEFGIDNGISGNLRTDKIQKELLKK